MMFRITLETNLKKMNTKTIAIPQMLFKAAAISLLILGALIHQFNCCLI